MENQVLSILLDLQKDIKNMDGRLGNIEQDASGLKQDVSGLKQGQANLEQGQRLLQQDVSGLKQGQEALQQDFSGLKQGQANLEQGQETLQTDMTEIKQRTTKIEIILENDISKKLGTLFDGHDLDSEKLSKLDSIERTVEATKDTVDVMFNVIKKHSGEIKELQLAK